MAPEPDQVGLGWRPELAAGIFAHLDQIDLVEVIADDLFDGSRRQLSAIATLSAQVPVVLHGVSLGLASTAPLDERRLSRLARVVERVRPRRWSEHLAFVRGGGVEIGHLAAPPRHPATLEGTLRNLARAEKVVGTRPLVENVATLLEPPGSTFDELHWLDQVLRGSGADLLLDLHNLHANAVNFGFRALDLFDRIPLDRVAQVHLAGGRFIPMRGGGERLLDDHLHAVPEPVFALLTELAARCPQPLTVLLERDGAYPAFPVLLAELQRARSALAVGRARR